MTKTIKQERNDELYAAFLKHYEGVPYMEAVRRAVDGGCSRHFFPADMVYRRISAMEKGITKYRGRNMSNTRKDFYVDVFRKYMELKSTESLKNKPRIEIVEFLLSRPAKSFYMDYEYAGKLIKRMQREKRKELLIKLKKQRRNGKEENF